MRLDGLPLALELAAVWTSILSPAQILDRLSKRFDFLISRRKGRLARHQTLRAAIEWSYHLLSASQQEFFVKLSVFSRGWSAESAQYVCKEPKAMEMLHTLQKQSLVIVEQLGTAGTEIARFDFLQTIREFADAELSEDERL